MVVMDVVVVVREVVAVVEVGVELVDGMWCW